MAAGAGLSEILPDFTASTQSALESLPGASAFVPPENGISLLDTKNEIFLSYLQALALRNLNVIRSFKDGASWEDAQELSNKITSKLVEHRVYLERGVRPLEQKLKYQVDKVIKAAEDEIRVSTRKAKEAATPNGKYKDRDSESSGDDSDGTSSDESISAGEEGDATAFRPRAANMSRSKPELDTNRLSRSQEDGVYRPPRVSATSMPTTEQREPKERRQPRSRTLDEYVGTELSNAPAAEPSIGSTITAGGRKNKDARQLAKEQERRDYEETNLMRLPKESKKERAKQAGRDRGGFGGEEWREIGDSVDRIGDLTKRKGKDSALDKSRKRPVEDGPRSDGIGDAFNVKKRRLMKKMRR